jgi:DNA-binding response OmpR family regulator
MVLTTGDTVSHEAETVAAATGAILVHKPFDLEHLRAAVRAGLGRPRTP